MKPSASSFSFRVCCTLLFFFAAAASFHGFYDKWHFRESGMIGGAGGYGDQLFGLAEILDGKAARPYVLSQLVPASANWLDGVTPQPIKDGLYELIRDTVLARAAGFDTSMAGDQRYFFRYWVVYLLTFLFAWLAVYGMLLVCRGFGAPALVCVIAPVVVILLVPYFTSVGGYFYDYPDMAFLALAVWMSLRFSWWWMLPLVVLAACNRPTFVLEIVALYPLLRQRGTRVRAGIGVGVLGLASVFVSGAIWMRFRANPGHLVFSRWRVQLAWFTYPAHIFKTETTYGIPILRLYSVVPMLLLIWIVWRNWRRLSPLMQRYGKFAVAITVPYYFLFAMPSETRELGMLYVVFLLVVAVILTPQGETCAVLEESTPGRAAKPTSRNGTEFNRSSEGYEQS